LVSELRLDIMANKTIGEEAQGRVDHAAEITAVENQVEMATIPSTMAMQAVKQDDPYLVAFAEPFDAENPK
jgi:hypothetical protein